MTNVEMRENDHSSAPIDGSERLEILDILRGFALMGVFFSNVHVWFSGRIFLPKSQQDQIMADPVNAGIEAMERYLSGGKFVTIFSFLFGVGLAVQFDRAEKRSSSAVHFYLRRGSIMLLLGAAHLFLVWFGDILHLYALAGFVVLLFLRRKPSTILVWGLGLTLFSGACAKWLGTLIPPLFFSPEELALRALQQSPTMNQTDAWMLAQFKGNSWAAIVHANALGYWVRFVNWGALGFLGEVVGRVLLGYYAGRIGLFRDLRAHRRSFVVLLGVGLFLGVFAELLRQVLEKNNGHSVANGVGSLLPGFMRILSHLHTTGLAAFYIATLSLLVIRPWWQEKLHVFAPAGRMAITNYLSQSMIAIGIFYGVGLGHIGTVTAWTTFWMPLGILALQMVISQVWLRHFRFGPIEWVWRSLTYGRKQPMRR